MALDEAESYGEFECVEFADGLINNSVVGCVDTETDSVCIVVIDELDTKDELGQVV